MRRDLLAVALGVILTGGVGGLSNSAWVSAASRVQASVSSDQCTKVKQAVGAGRTKKIKTFCLLQSPGYATVDGQGNVYVTVGAQYNNPTLRAGVVKFSASGVVLGILGSHGTGRGQFINPLGIVVDRYGDMYISDASLNRIQEISPTGKVLAVFGHPGTGPGALNYPSGLALDPQGNIWVADDFDGRLHAFTDRGQFIRTCCRLPAEFSNVEPSDVKISPDGTMYVTDHRSAEMLKFSAVGRFLGHSQDFGNIATLAMDTHDDLYLGASGDPKRQGVLIVPKLSPALKVSAWIPAPVSDDAVTVDRAGNLYLLDNEGGNRVVKLAPDGTQRAVWK